MSKELDFTKKYFPKMIFVRIFSVILALWSTQMAIESLARSSGGEENIGYSSPKEASGKVLSVSGWKNIAAEDRFFSAESGSKKRDEIGNDSFAPEFSGNTVSDFSGSLKSEQYLKDGFSNDARPVSYCETVEVPASTPCVAVHDSAFLGYPWNRKCCMESEAYCVVRGQNGLSSPETAGSGLLTEGVGEGVQETAEFSNGIPVTGYAAATDGAILTNGAAFWDNTPEVGGAFSGGLASDSLDNALGGRVGSGRTIGGGEVLYSPEEERYHYWDSRFKSCIPGLGRELPTSNEPWTWQMTPGGTLYRAHFASNREGRLGIHFVNEDTTGLAYWDPTLGGRINLIRYGTCSRIYPEGFQWDVECGAIARLTLKGDRDLHGTDYRIAFPLTFRKGNWEFKFGYYHISSHMGDEWIVKHYEATGEVYRINYVRDCLMWGIAFRPDANWRFYIGGDYVFWRDCGAKPLQFEAGAEYSPMLLPNFQGSPFLALHFRWSEDTDFDTYSALEAGWQWKTVYQQTLRTGLYAMAGYADQYQFYDRWEKQIGYGIWFDF